MKRRSFFAALAGLPLVGKLFADKEAKADSWMRITEYTPCEPLNFSHITCEFDVMTGFEWVQEETPHRDCGFLMSYVPKTVRVKVMADGRMYCPEMGEKLRKAKEQARKEALTTTFPGEKDEMP